MAPKLGLQFRVIGALLVREMTTRFGRSRMGYLWALIEPVGVIALLVALFSQVADAPPVGRSFALFFASGFLAFSLWNDVASVTGRSVHVNRPLLCYPVVTALDTVLARFLLQVLTSLAVGVVVLGGIFILFRDPVALDLGALFTGLALGALLGLGTGLVNTAAFAWSPSWELAWGIVSRPLLLVSCVFFTFETMPRHVQEVLWYNPLVHLVGLMRSALYPAYDAGYVSVVYLLYLGLGLSFAGLLAMRGATRRITEA